MEMTYAYGTYQMSSWPMLLGIGGHFIFFCLCVLGIILFIRRPWRKNR